MIIDVIKTTRKKYQIEIETPYYFSDYPYKYGYGCTGKIDNNRLIIIDESFENGDSDISVSSAEITDPVGQAEVYRYFSEENKSTKEEFDAALERAKGFIDGLGG